MHFLFNFFSFDFHPLLEDVFLFILHPSYTAPFFIPSFRHEKEVRNPKTFEGTNSPIGWERERERERERSTKFDLFLFFFPFAPIGLTIIIIKIVLNFQYN
jgi:hypothetical protein